MWAVSGVKAPSQIRWLPHPPWLGSCPLLGVHKGRAAVGGASHRPGHKALGLFSAFEPLLPFKVLPKCKK